MAEKPASRGRGAALKDLLKKHKEGQLLGVDPQEEKVPPKARGRAAMLQKLQEMKESKVGLVKEDQPLPSVQAPPKTLQTVASITRAVDELSIAAESTSSGPRCYRGVDGQRFDASANYIKLRVAEDRGLYEYEVRFNPAVDARSFRIKLVNQHLGALATTKVYDGDVNLYLPYQAFKERSEFKGTMPDNDEPVTTILIYKKKQKLSECLHLYNVLFRRIMHILLYTRIGRNYFSTDHKHSIPQHKLEVFPGYAVHVDEVEDGLTVCLDTQHRVIRSNTVYEFLQDLCATDRSQFKQLAISAIVGTCVLTRYNNKTLIVDDLAWNMSPKDTFPMKDGRDVSFIEYYKTQYGLVINDHDQPMLIHRQSKNIQGTKVETMICLVPEFCYLTGLSDAMRADFKVMKDVAAYTRVTPNQRIGALKAYLRNVAECAKAQDILGAWGLSLDTNPIKIDGRVLPGETVKFGNEAFCRKEDWNREVGMNSVTGPVDMINWIVFYTQRDAKHAQNFAESMVRLAKGMGCMIKPPQLVMLPDDRTDTYMNQCRNKLGPNVQIAVFICPTLRADRYTIIKKICCVQIPMASQVILSKTLNNPAKVRAIIYKIALQMTAKLGGTLWNVSIPFNRWMVCGIDVYHGKGYQSVCGFVASINGDLTKWFSEAVFQEREIGDFFKIAFKKALRAYHNALGSYPQKLIIFRDGVGDGQFGHCKQYEIKQFDDVFKELGIECTITFIIVQKRINTRIYKLTSSGADNPPAGTVVDTAVTRRNLADFFLVPQSVRQGTVNPTHYVVLHDTAQIKPDHIQRLAFKLCHLYYNWPGTIRVPAPCQYAHKLAGLMGQYIKQTPSPELSDKLYYL